jgi:hypothetical protein
MQIVHKVQRHRDQFQPSERNNGTNSPQKLFTVLPIALIIEIYNWCFTLRYVSSKNLVSHNYHKVNIQH